MKLMKFSFFVFTAFVFLSSCKKEDALVVDNISGLGGDSTAQTVVDKWLYDSLTVPYNIDTRYKWNQFTVNEIDKNVVPIKEANVIPVMDAVRRVWAFPYIAQTDKIFFNMYAPKYFVLAGSSATTPDGSAILGVAGGGKQITLMQLNYFRNKGMPGYVTADTALQKIVFMTVHHEFSHIFDQTKKRPSDFDKVTQSGYSSDWINITDDDARKKGFVSAYASSAAGEDFAEMVSFMLVYGRGGWNKLVSKITVASARTALQAKESIIVGYFQQSWGIDFYGLQSRVRAAIEKEFY